MKSIVALSLIILFISACKKPEDRRCWKTAGKEIEMTLPVAPFSKLFLHEHIEFVLVQDSIEKVVLTGGENLLNRISVTVSDGLLDIKNENKCAFFRSYDKKVKAEIHFKGIENIHYEGSESLTNKGKLNFSWLTLLVRDGAGPVNLNFDAYVVIATVSHGWGDFTFSGSVNYANLNVWSNGFCNTYGLKVKDSISVVSTTQGPVHINADQAKLKAETNGSGNIYYRGTPSSIAFHKYALGDLINDN
jgi:hypothetical protein